MATSRMISRPTGLEISSPNRAQARWCVLCHGWPELSHSWRHQIPGPRGCRFPCRRPRYARLRRTSAPPGASTPTRIFDNGRRHGRAGGGARRASEAIIIGHDWGAPVAWHCGAVQARYLQQRLAGLSVRRPSAGASGRSRRCARAASPNSTGSISRRRASPKQEFERDVDYTCAPWPTAGLEASLFLPETGNGFLGRHVDPAEVWPDWLSRPTSAHVVENLRGVRLSRRLNWYRNLDRNWELTAPWQGAKIQSAVASSSPSAEGCRHHRHDRRQARHRNGARALPEPEAQADHRRRRPLDPAGTARTR